MGSCKSHPFPSSVTACRTHRHSRASDLLAACVLCAFVFGVTIGLLIPFHVISSPVSAPLNRSCGVAIVADYPSEVRRDPEDMISPSSLFPPARLGANLQVEVESTSRFPAESRLPPGTVQENRTWAQLTEPSWKRLLFPSPPKRGLAPSGRIVTGVYWSDEMERELPEGFGSREDEEWRKVCRQSVVVKMEESCGRKHNRMLTFESGLRSCCRYRQNQDQIQGEILSFHLGRILGIRNVIPSTLSVVDSRSWRWNSVRSHLNLAQWEEGRPIVLSKFLDRLSPAHIPEPFRSPSRRLHPTDIPLLNLTMERDRDRLVELVQWSDLIVFDYLTANLDRVVNNMYNLQWNPTMMEAPAHNLGKLGDTGLLVFFDNESGLLHGYRLLGKYEPYHRALLDSLCIFRKKTADAVKKLHASGIIGDLMEKASAHGEGATLQGFARLPHKNVKILNSRLETIYKRIKYCESLYSS